MIDRKLIIILSVIFYTLQALGQTLTNKNIELPPDWNSAVSTYVARDYVRLSPGFSFTGSASGGLTLRIDESIVVPADYGSASSFPTPESRTINKSLPLGSLPGAASVSPLGGAVYQVPIPVPPGTAGVVPNISLVYNSQGGDGFLGKGWSIGGLSAITRTSQDHYHENYISGINFDDNDRFMLDGNRLILVTGTYGVAGSVYRTESETFQKVTLYGSGNSQYFIVITKDGHTLEYGKVYSSRVTLSGTGRVFTWCLNKSTDLNSNFIEYIYRQENGEIRIHEIKYTGRTTVSGDNTIAFYYDERSDKNTYYIGGGRIVRKHLLRQIKVFSFGELQKSFKFRYSGDKSSLLHEMTEYSPSGQHLNSTYLGWQYQTAGYNRIEMPADPCNDKNLYGDFNGDGRKDLLMHVFHDDGSNYTSADKWKVFLGQKDMTFAFAYEGSLVKGFKQFLVGDFDEDGDDDILMRVWKKYSETITVPCSDTKNGSDQIKVTGGTNTLQTPKNALQDAQQLIIPPEDGVCYQSFTWWQNDLLFYSFSGGSMAHDSDKDIVGNREENDIIYTVDLDGDGDLEYLYLGSGLTFSSVRGLNVRATEYFTSPDFVRFIDFNGNGKTDIMVVKGDNTKIFEYNGFSLATIFNSNGIFNTWHRQRIFAGDFNGDRLTDFLSYDEDNKWYRYMGNGKTFIKVSLTGLEGNLTNTSRTNNYQVCDINGDGTSDILEITHTPTRKFNIYKNYSLNFIKESQSYSVPDVQRAVFFDIDGNGLNELIYTLSTPRSKFHIFSFSVNEPRFIQSVSNGLGLRTKFTYTKQNCRGIFYNSDREIISDFSNYSVNMWTVQALEHHSQDKRIARQTYAYSGATIHREGKGFLGFEQIKVSDYYTGSEITNNYTFRHTGNGRVYFFSGLHESIKKIGGSLVETTTIDYGIKTYAPSKSFFAYAGTKTTVNNLTGVTVTEGYEYDGEGNQTKSTVQYGSDGTVTVTNTFTKVGTLNATRLQDSQKSRKYRTEDVNNTFVFYSYDGLGNVSQINGQGYKTNYTVDKYGNVLTEKISGTDIVTSTRKYTYDTKGRFMLSSTNALGQTESMAYDNMGRVLAHKGIDGNTSRYGYDSFGNLIKTTSPDGQVSNYSYHWAGDNSFNALYYTYITTSGSPYKRTYCDILGRKVKIQMDSYNGEMAVDKTFNSKGELVKETFPYLVGQGSSSAPYSLYYYDKYGRPTTTTSNGLTTQTSYSGKTVSTTLPSGETINKWYDSFGQGLVTETTLSSRLIFSNYYSDGNLKNISAGGATYSMAYDANGYQRSLQDPNAGAYTYDYNGLGQLLSQVSPNGTVSITYDGMGRVKEKTTPDATLGYSYVTGGPGIGQIDKVTAGTEVLEDYDYDRYGRLTAYKQKVDDIYLTRKYFYDVNGRVSRIDYPDNFGITYHYDNIGTLVEIRTSENALVWKLNNINQDGQISSYSYGNGLATSLSYDSYKQLTGISTGSVQGLTYNFDAAKGQLTSRKGLISNVQEDFAYDYLNQLTEVSSTMPELGQLMSYSDYVPGNITGKSDVGDYYYGTPAGPHALIKIDNPVSSMANLANQNITYTWFNKVSTITEGDYAIGFTYGAGQQRASMEVKKSGATARKVYYFGAYEKHIEGNTVRHIYQIQGPNGLVAIYKKEGSSGEMYYVHTDHLGSVHTVTGQDKTVRGRYYYDAWGNRKELALDGNGFGSTENLPWLHRGYTSHEHIEEVNLVNMNGRVYDPVLGRFLSPDPYIQAPDMPVSFNRYAYCLNNPLIYTDPDGEIIFGLIRGLFDAIKSGGINPHLSKESRREAWTNADPFLRGTAPNNSARIWGGLFTTNDNKNFLGRIWELRSRFTWQLPQTAAGFLTGHFTNVFKDVYAVDYYDGSTVLETSWGGGSFTLGSYIELGNGEHIYEEYWDPITGRLEEGLGATFMHEYGHYMQSQKVGPFYAFKYAIPSKFTDNFSKPEMDANSRAYDYFSLIHASDMPIYATGWTFDPTTGTLVPTTTDWNEARYPRGYNRLKWWEAALPPLWPIMSLWNY